MAAQGLGDRSCRVPTAITAIPTFIWTSSVSTNVLAGEFGCYPGKGIDAVPIAAPLPDVSGHIVEAVAVRWKRFHGRGSRKSIFRCISDRKNPLPGIGHPLTARTKFVTPRITFVLQTAPRSVLPLGFGWKPFTGPLRIGNGVIPGHLDHWMALPSRNVALRPLWMTPTGS